MLKKSFLFFPQMSVYAFTIFFSFLALNLLHLLPVFEELLNAGCYLFHTPPDFDLI